ncbi:MAG: hypothetical protein M3407_10665 [Acidobacteriota bacterium]|nr:hypothetical protein [Acidobacteriota bacterium]
MIDQIRCQRCRAVNPLGEELCAQCGTRLMLVIEPTKQRFEEESTASGHDEYLVERISILENHLLRMIDKVERGLDLLMRQSQVSLQQQILVETLISALDEAGVIGRERLLSQWRESCDENESKPRQEEQRRERLIEQTLEGVPAESRKEFELLAREGFTLIDMREREKGFRVLERAAALAPQSAALNFVLGGELFMSRRMTLARDYLERTVRAGAENPLIFLLLALTYADAGEIDSAQQIFQKLPAPLRQTFAATYAVGRLAALEGDWTRALSEFKKAQAANPSPEVQYLVGLAQYQLGRYKLTLRYAEKTLAADAKYAAALFLKGLACVRLGDSATARQAFALARSLGHDLPPQASARRRKFDIAELEGCLELSFFGAARQRKQQLLLSGDERLAAKLIDDAMGEAVVAAR